MVSMAQSTEQCECCNVDACPSMQRLISVLTVYDEWLYNEPNKEENPITAVLQKSFSKYSMRDILRDHDHIKQREYNLFSANNGCTQSSSPCIPSRRHQRDNNQQIQSYFVHGIPAIIAQKTLDQIHLYLYHPFNGQSQRFGTDITTVSEDDDEEEEEKYE